MGRTGFGVIMSNNLIDWEAAKNLAPRKGRQPFSAHEGPTLLDKYMAALQQPDKKLLNATGKSIAKNRDVIAERQRARQAHVFIVDDQLLKHLFMTYAKACPHWMLEAIKTVRLPYDTMWIENFEHDATEYEHDAWGTPKVLRDHDNLHTDQKRGVFLEAIYHNNEQIGFNYYVVQDMYAEKRISATPVSFAVFNDRKVVAKPLSGYFEKTAIKSLIEKAYGKRWCESKRESHEEQLHLLGEHLQFHTTQASWQYLKSDDTEEVGHWNGRALASQMGTLPYIVWLLTTLNDNQQAVQAHDVVKRKRYMINGQSRTGVDYKTLTIDLSKTRVNHDEIKLGNGPSKREHDVMGHWRHYRNADGSLKRKVWIRSHKRGDAALGVVIKDYQLTH